MSLARWKAPLAFVLSLGLCACTASRIPAEYRARYAGLPDDAIDLMVQSDEAHQEFVRQGMISQNTSLTRYVESITAKLASPELQGAQVRPHVYVLRDPQINAMAMPNGNIYVNEGLLVRFQNEAQIAFVLGHELSHVTEQHSLKARETTKTTAVLVNTAGVVINPGLSVTAASLFLSKHSRDAEREADLKGLSLMCTAGYRPDEAASAIALLRDTRSTEAMEGSVWGSHPGLGERIQALETAALSTPGCDGPQTVGDTPFQAVITDDVFQNVIEMKMRRRSYVSAFEASEARARQRPGEARYAYLMGESLRLQARDSKGAAEESVYLKTGKLPSEKETLSSMNAFEAERPETEAEAAKHLQAAIALDASYAPAYRALGLLAQQQGRNDEARSKLERYLALAPDAKDKLFVLSVLKSIH